MREERNVGRGDAPRPPRYTAKLLALLSVATYFEGYDGFVLGFVIAAILKDFGATVSAAGLIKAITVTGSIVAFFLAARSDRIGRRRLLLITIVGYTGATLLTAASVNLVMLTASQFAAQVFLGAEWAAAMTMLVEEVPAEQRGRLLGILTSMGTFGGVSVGLLAFAGLESTPLGWRAFYLVGIIPLIVVAIGRRGLLETERFVAIRADAGKDLDDKSWTAPWKGAYRGTLVAVGLIHFFRYLAVAAGVFWWPFYAQQEVGMSVSRSGLYLAVGGILGAVGFIAAGRLMEAPPLLSPLHLPCVCFGRDAVSSPLDDRDAPAAVWSDILRIGLRLHDERVCDRDVPHLYPRSFGYLGQERFRDSGRHSRAFHRGLARRSHQRPHRLCRRCREHALSRRGDPGDLHRLALYRRDQGP
jgi:MFS family permease